MKLISFFIDELGSASPKATNSSIYILSGIMANTQARDALRIRANQIKFKYWNDVNVIFHSREIGRKEGSFKILKDKTTSNNFHKDLFELLNTGGYQLFAVVVDKKKIPKNWTEVTIYKKTSHAIIRNFILSLLANKNCKGRLVVESATAQKDFYYHREAGYFLSNGFPDLKIDFSQVQNVLTEISFVTKKNHDIEEQIADILAYGVRLKYESASIKTKSSYQKKLLRVVEQKLFKPNASTGEKKMKFHSQIESFEILS